MVVTPFADCTTTLHGPRATALSFASALGCAGVTETCTVSPTRAADRSARTMPAASRSTERQSSKGSRRGRIWGTSAIGRTRTEAATPPAQGPTLRAAPTSGGAFQVSSASPCASVRDLLVQPVALDEEGRGDRPPVPVEHAEEDALRDAGHDLARLGIERRRRGAGAHLHRRGGVEVVPVDVGPDDDLHRRPDALHHRARRVGAAVHLARRVGVRARRRLDPRVVVRGRRRPPRARPVAHRQPGDGLARRVAHVDPERGAVARLHGGLDPHRAERGLARRLLARGERDPPGRAVVARPASACASSVHVHAGSSLRGMGTRAIALPAASVTTLASKRGTPPSISATCTGAPATGSPRLALPTSTHAEMVLPGTTRVSGT